MSFIYDIKTDLRYIQGMEDGKKKGVKKGAARTKQELVVRMIKKLPGLRIKKIAKIAKVPVAYARKIRRKFKKKNKSVL